MATERYWLQIHPHVRRELRHWRLRAHQIPDPMLRSLALGTQRSKSGNLEGAAAFATFAPAARRASVVRASVALQALYDFADTLMEHQDQSANARQLHATLHAALLTPTASLDDCCADRPGCEDGGYMAGLIDTSRAALAQLPSYESVHELAQRNVARIVRYQTLIDRPSAFAVWSETETPPGADLRWWETGAACGSSMGIFALIASAADPGLRRRDAAMLERAYFPWIGSLHTLLDSLIDRPEDLATGQQSLIGHYRSAEATADRTGFIAAEAARRALALPSGVDHALILAGMTSQYLSSPNAGLPHARPARDSIAQAMGDLAAPTMAVFGARRLLGRVRA